VLRGEVAVVVAQAGSGRLEYPSTIRGALVDLHACTSIGNHLTIDAQFRRDGRDVRHVSLLFACRVAGKVRREASSSHGGSKVAGLEIDLSLDRQFAGSADAGLLVSAPQAGGRSSIVGLAPRSEKRVDVLRIDQPTRAQRPQLRGDRL
jgi:hypothetical protein